MNQVQLENVRDILEIQMVKARYCQTADALPQKGEAAALGFNDIFTADVVADYGLGRLEGREAVVHFLLNEAACDQAWMWHGIHSPQVDVQGDTANASWTIIARMKPKASAEMQTVIGRYFDQFHRTSEGWRISTVRFNGEVTLTQKYDAQSGDVIFGA